MKWFPIALAALLISSASAALGADPVGPPMGNNKYKGTISGAADRDEFTGRFFRGDVLTVTVSAAKKGKAPPSLRPVLTLVDPDGIVRTAGIVPAPTGTSVALKDFSIDKPGLWAARVEGAGGTSGDFLVTFKTKALPKQVYTLQRLGDDQPFSRAYDIPAFPGAILDATVTWTGQSQAVEFRELHDPVGTDVPGKGGLPATSAATRKGRTSTLKGVALAGGTGEYVLWVGIPTANAQYTLTVAVRNPTRVKSTKLTTLPAVEPILDPLAGPVVSTAGQTVRFTGTGFSTGRAPTVLVGETRSTSVTVAAGGTAIDVVIPARGTDTVVPVYVWNPDGQGMGRDLYFAYLPAPVVNDLVDASTGTPVRVSPAPGGRAVRLLGANFEATQTITIGGVAVRSPLLVNEGEFRFSLPAAYDGDRALTVADLYTRSGTSSFTVRYKTPPAFAADPYAPGALQLSTPTQVTITGTAFQPTDQLRFAGNQIPSTWVSSTTRTFDLPALGSGTYSVQLVDSIGTVVDGPGLVAKAAPTITAVTVVGGASLGTNQIPIAGGSTLRVDGTEFLANDTVTLGGVIVKTFVTRTATRKEFVAPQGSAGYASLTVTDGASQSATFADAVQYVGFLDVAYRTPTPSAADDWSAVRGASADLDLDGLADDVVLVSPFNNRPGSQVRQTRVLLGGDDGVLADATTGAIPPAFTDNTGSDAWDGNCVAIGDLDLSGSPDIVIGGQVAVATTAGQVRLFRNDGSGAFSLDQYYVDSTREAPTVVGGYYRYYYMYQYTIYGRSAQSGAVQALALGDLDMDGDLDVVAGADSSQTRAVYLDPKYVDFSQNPPRISRRVNVNYQQYLPALRVLRNDLPANGKLYDDSVAALPAAGRSTDITPPAFHTRDVAIGDVNGDGLPDIVAAWDDPFTVTHYGQSTLLSGGTSLDSPRVATRILLNSSKTPGTFTDATATWLPAGAGNEYWQADRVALADLDGDGDLDLLLVSAKGLDAWVGTPTYSARALRVLRNDKTKYTDVTASAVPAVDATAKDDWRSEALLVRDVDADGRLDVLLGTQVPLMNPNFTAAPRLRFFRGLSGASIGFARPTAFQVPVQYDTGEASDLFVAEDLAGFGNPVILIVGETRPSMSNQGRWFRAQEWLR